MNGTSESNSAIIAMEIETAETKATPTPSGRKRPQPQDSDESEEEIGVRRVSLPREAKMTTYGSYEKFINIIAILTPFFLQTPSGRPKHVAAMGPGERQRARRRAKRSLDSEDSGTVGGG